MTNEHDTIELHTISSLEITEALSDIINYGIKTTRVPRNGVNDPEFKYKQEVVPITTIAKKLSDSKIRSEKDIALSVLVDIARMFNDPNLELMRDFGEYGQSAEDINILLKPIAAKYGIDWKGINGGI